MGEAEEMKRDPPFEAIYEVAYVTHDEVKLAKPTESRLRKFLRRFFFAGGPSFPYFPKAKVGDLVTVTIHFADKKEDKK